MPLKKLSVKELMNLRGVSYPTALKEHKALRQTLDKEFITYQDFADYEGMELTKLDAILTKKVK